MEVSNGFGKRCGEVFITRQKLYIFHCSLCHNKYEDFSALLNHITEEHYNKIVWSSDEKDHIGVDHFEENEAECDELCEEQNVDIKQEIGKEMNDVFEIECSPDESMYNFNEKQKGNSAAQNNGSEDENATEDRDECTIVLYQKLKKKKGRDSEYSECTICKQRFRLKSFLKTHISYKHSDERNFKCDQCDSTFKTKNNLRSHQRRHDISRKFECTICLKKFCTNGELVIHDRIHTGERPYICAVCGKAFIRSGLLLIHMRRHNNDRRYKCDHCEKSFYTKHDRKKHLVVHTEERKYSCNECQLAFKLRKTLHEHMKIHINARENKCGICNAAFNQRTGLLIHMKQTHKVLSIGSKSDLRQT